MNAPTSEHDRLYEKWRTWLARVTDDVTIMAASRTIWRELVEMVETSEPPHVRHFMRWLRQLYANDLTMGLRRQVDTRDDVISVGRLLTALEKNPRVVTRDRFLSMWGGLSEPHMVTTANAAFDRWAIGAATLDPEVVACERERLNKAVAPLKLIADKRLAHYGKAGIEQDDVPTFAELDYALDRLIDIVERLHLLLRGTSFTLPPYLLQPWQRAFEQAWAPRRRGNPS